MQGRYTSYTRTNRVQDDSRTGPVDPRHAWMESSERPARSAQPGPRHPQEHLPHAGDRLFTAPGQALDHQACGARLHLQQPGGSSIRTPGTDAMLRARPDTFCSSQLPGAVVLKSTSSTSGTPTGLIRRCSSASGRPSARQRIASSSRCRPAPLHRHCRCRPAQLALQQAVRVLMAARTDLHRDIGNLQRHLFQVRRLTRHE